MKHHLRAAGWPWLVPLRSGPRAICSGALGALLGAWLLVTPAGAAELRGRITLANGQPAASEPILLKGKPIGRTDVAGVYWLNLPAGAHVLTVKGQEVPVRVSPNGSREDIKLK